MNDVEDVDVDNDSLFGSPPPSPVRGRSPSLALPSTSTGSAHENVGTIALPGSHNCSELPVNPPAWPSLSASSSRSHSEAYQRPAFRATSHPITVPKPQRLPPKKSGKQRAESSTPRPAPPPIPLPDPEEPVPSNFLRNQQALLGLAGLVGGVNPANLSKRSSRGTTSTNPIVVEEEAPTIGPSTWKRGFSATLPSPTSDEIVAAMISQKNIFPVLRDLLPFLRSSSSLSTTDQPSRSGSEPLRPQPPRAFERGQPYEAPPLKRRKLHRVPAGAADWNVPYPFPQEEGPPDYYSNWEKERGKRLLAQLVSLVKEAVQKAAIKSYAQKRKQAEHGANERYGSYYRSPTPSSITNTVSPTPSSSLLAGAPSTSAVTNTLPTDPCVGRSTPFDQFIASLLASQQLAPITPSSEDSRPSPASESCQQDMDSFQKELDALLSEIKTDQQTENPALMCSMTDTSVTGTSSPALTSSTRLPTPFDSNKENDAPNVDVSALDSFDYSPATDMDYNFDFAIDPILLNMSQLQPKPLESVPARVSLRGGDPAMILPPSSVQSPVWPSQSVIDMPIPGWDNGSSGSLVNSTMAWSSSPTPISAVTPVTASTFSALPQTVQPNSTVRGSSKRPAAGKSKETVPLPVRHELLMKAKVRREQLQAEIARAKVELWETTIEQGVLVDLLKDKDLQ